MSKIKYLVMDVDGTLTDGKIYIGQDGEAIKAFDIKDGCGIVLVLPKYDIVPVIITARESRIVKNRCDELGITELYQGSKNKLQTLQAFLEKNCDSLNAVSYVGDDIPDISSMEAVKAAGGIVMCPADAISEIRAMADYVSSYDAGSGAIRDCINFLVNGNTLRNSVNEKIQKAIDSIPQIIEENKLSGAICDGVTFSVQEYITKNEEECLIECHRHHIDVQYIVEGCEEFVVYDSVGLFSASRYDYKKDVEYWQGGVQISKTVLVPGSTVIVYEGQAHKGAIVCGREQHIKKIVCKIEV